MILKIYTDGASRGNPGPGGYGALLIWGSKQKELAAGYRLTTNNRMELLAVIKAIESLTRTGIQIEVFSDSKYVVDAVTKNWVFGWEKTNFKDKKNPDLWKQYLKLHRQYNISFTWVKGHADNPYNNRCDQLATQAADSGNLLVDTAFEETFYNS